MISYIQPLNISALPHGNIHPKYPKSTVHTSSSFPQHIIDNYQKNVIIIIKKSLCGSIKCWGERKESIPIQCLIGIFFVTSQISLFDDLLPPFPPERTLLFELAWQAERQKRERGSLSFIFSLLLWMLFFISRRSPWLTAFRF